MRRSHKAYYWLLILLIPCMLGIDRCGTLLFLTGEDPQNSPTEPCIEYIQTPTPISILPSLNEPDGGRTPVIQDGEPVVGPDIPIILPTPVVSAFTVEVTTLHNIASCGGVISPSAGTYDVDKGTIITLSAFPSFSCYHGILVDGVVVNSGFMSGGSYNLTVTGDHDVYMCIDTGVCW